MVQATAQAGSRVRQNHRRLHQGTGRATEARQCVVSAGLGTCMELLSSWKLRWNVSCMWRETWGFAKENCWHLRKQGPKSPKSHTLELEGQAYHFSWSKWCTKEPQRLNMGLWGLVFTQEGSVLFPSTFLIMTLFLFFLEQKWLPATACL